MISFKKYLKMLTEMTSIEALSKAKKLDIPVNLNEITREEAIKICPEAVDFYDELIYTIMTNTYSRSVKFIKNIIKDPKLKFILSLGFGGNFSNYKLSINTEILKAKDLIPTQNELSINETLDFVIGNCKVFNPDDIDICFNHNAIIRKPILVYNHKYIIDGHHRWGQIFIVNPEASVQVVNISGNINLITLLKAIQCTIGSNLGKLNLKSLKGVNLYTEPDASIHKRIIQFITDKSLETLSRFFKNPITTILQNTLLLKQYRGKIDYDIKRLSMPQTSKDSNLFADLQTGICLHSGLNNR